MTVFGVAVAVLGVLVSVAYADTTPQSLPLSQDFTDTSLIASDNDWSLVPGIIGYRGDNMAAEGSDPQLVTADGSNTPVVVYANNTQPSAFNKGGVAEFHRTNQTPPNDTNPAVAFQGNVTSDAPHLVLSLDTTGQSNLRVAYTLRDIDGGSNDSVTPVALQYRVGSSGPYTNLPEGYVADATTGPNLAVLDTRVSAALPAAANDEPLVQVRIITVNSVTQDEWIGVDYISAFSANPAIDLNGGGSGTGYSATFTEDGGSVAIVDNAALTVNDADSTTLSSATATITNLQDGTAESLSADTTSTPITASYNPSTGVLTLSGSGTLAQYQQVLRTVRYNNTSQNPGTTARSVNFVVSDGTYDSNTATSTVTVNRVNDAPDANGDTATADEDTPLDINVKGNDTDADGDSLNITGVSDPPNGTVTINADGTVAYVPDADFTGEDSFTYTVSDGNGGTDTAAVTVTVRPVNDAPVADDDTATTGEDTAVVIDVLDGDAPGPVNESAQTLRVDAITTPPAHGIAEIIATGPDAGKIRYTPEADYSGPDSFEYRVCDDGQTNGADDPKCDTATVSITVTAVNNAPVAQADNYRATEDTILTVDAPGVLINDSDVDGVPLSAELGISTTNGTLNLRADGSFTYTPNSNFNGDDTFTYRACELANPTVCSDPQTVTITVNAVNDAPDAVNDTADTPEDSAKDINVLSDDTDVENDPLRITGFTQPTNGTVACTPEGVCTYTPNANFNGTDAFTYEVCDARDECDTATVTVSVAPIDDALVVRDDLGSTGEAEAVSNAFISQYASEASDPTHLYQLDTAQRPYAFTNVGADIPYRINAIGYRSTDGSLYGYRLKSSPGIVKINPDTGAALYLGNPRGLPAKSYFAGDVSPDGSTYYLYTGKSGMLWQVDLTTFQVSSVKLSPAKRVADLAVSPTDGNLYGVARNGMLLRVDPRTGRVTASSLAGLKPGAYGAAWFTPEGDLVAYENGSSRAGGTMTLIARPTTAPSVVSRQAGPSTRGNDGAAYVAPPDPAGLSVVVDVLLNDGDPDDALDLNTLRIVQPPANGTVSINADKTITYTSGSSYRGTDSFRYEVCNNGAPGQCGTATVDITSAPVTSSAASRKE